MSDRVNNTNRLNGRDYGRYGNKDVHLTENGKCEKKLGGGKTIIKLPSTHPSLPLDLLANPKSCASESIANAIADILDGIGFKAITENIKQTLDDSLEQKEAKNPDEFNEKKIKIHVVNKTDSGMEGDIKIEIKVRTQWGKGGETNSNATQSIELQDNMKMVLRWAQANLGRGSIVKILFYFVIFANTPF